MHTDTCQIKGSVIELLLCSEAHQHKDLNLHSQVKGSSLMCLMSMQRLELKAEGDSVVEILNTSITEAPVELEQQKATEGQHTQLLTSAACNMQVSECSVLNRIKVF